MQFYQSFPDFLQANENTVFRFWVYRRMFTPYEQQNAFSDESVFEDVHAETGVIRQCIPLGENDFLLGFQLTFGEEINEQYSNLQFYKLSEIRLSYYRDDQMEEE